MSGSAGLYYQLPPYTALGFKEDGALVNRSLDYMRVGVFSAGVDWRLRDRLIVSVEGFYKRYGDVPLSVTVGRKDAVTVTVRGAPFDHKSLSKTTVSRFQVK